MAIQNRRGIYSDFDPTKMVEGEFAVVQSGDPNTSDGKAVYISTQTGSVERVALYKDVTQAVSTAIDEVTEDVIEDINEGVVENVERAETAAENAEASAEEAAQILENKADVDGTYPSLYAGNLSSTRKYTDSVPYLMRKTAGGASKIGEREDDTIVGATVNVNQLAIIRTASFTANQGSTITELGQFAGVQTHKYMLVWTQTATLTSNTRNTMQVGNGGIDPIIRESASDNYHLSEGIYVWMPNTSNLTSGTWYVSHWAHTPSNDYSIADVMLIDLTMWLGSTIADYVFSLGANALTWLRSYGFITGDYIPYNAGSLESVEATAHKMVGFNQWDEEWEVGSYNVGNGNKMSRNDAIRAKNFIPVIPSTSYYFKCASHASAGDGVLLWYDKNKNFISVYYSVLNRTHISPVNAYYATFYIAPETTYNHDICINLSNPDRNGEYEPYKSATYSLGDDALNGIFNLDANNNLYADGDRKEADGKIERKYKILTITSNMITFPSNTYSNIQYARIAKPTDSIDRMKTSSKCMHTSFPVNTATSNWDDPNKVGYLFGGASYEDYWFGFPSGTTLGQAQTTLAGTQLVYKLATPTTEQSTPFTNPQICDPDGTEEYVTSNGVPVGHETKYYYDIKGLAEELIDVPDVPSSNGTYVLKATRSAGGINYEWVSEA